MPTLELTYPMGDLKPADYNPRRISPTAFGILQDSIRALGVVKPIILNADGTIVAGHQRTKAMTAIGLTSTPAVVLDGKARRADEIRFNLMHNSIETCATEARWTSPVDGAGYIEVHASEFECDRTNTSASVVSELTRLLTDYGAWGSVVCDSSGRVIANSDYVYACQLAEQPVLVYRLEDDKVLDFARFMGVDYGEYFYEPLDVKGWAQTHAQPNRLRGARAATGELEDRSTDNRSIVYTQMVQPHLAAHDSELRIVDFGAGREDHARELSKQGRDILAYEPHFRREGGDNFDVRHIVGEVRALGRAVRDRGLFDVVVLDSVLNSVINLRYQDLVLVTINALCAKDGVVFTNTRSLESARSRGRLKQKRSEKVRDIEFFDADNFTATYQSGKWTIQKFHGKAEYAALLRQYFGDVKVTDLSNGYHHAVCRDPLPLGEARYREALDAELNMELPGGFRHGKQAAAVSAITTAAVLRDGSE